MDWTSILKSCHFRHDAEEIINAFTTQFLTIWSSKHPVLLLHHNHVGMLDHVRSGLGLRFLIVRVDRTRDQ